MAVMPASLYPTSASIGGHLDLIMMSSASSASAVASSDHITSTISTSNGGGNGGSNFDDSRAAAENIALQLAMLQQGGHPETNGHGHGGHPGHPPTSAHHIPSASDLLNGHAGSGSLEDLKNTQRRSQNMTECVPVPSSEHVAEIVGRQGEFFKFLMLFYNISCM